MLSSGLFSAEGAQLPRLKVAERGLSKTLIEVSEDEEIRREIRQRLEAEKRN